jgi:hypothetical protein
MKPERILKRPAMPGAGRPPTGRKRLVLYVTDYELETILRVIPRFRKAHDLQKKGFDNGTGTKENS